MRIELTLWRVATATLPIWKGPLVGALGIEPRSHPYQRCTLTVVLYAIDVAGTAWELEPKQAYDPSFQDRAERTPRGNRTPTDWV